MPDNTVDAIGRDEFLFFRVIRKMVPYAAVVRNPANEMPVSIRDYSDLGIAAAFVAAP